MKDTYDNPKDQRSAERKDVLNAIYADAVAKIENEKKKRVQQGYGAMYIGSGFSGSRDEAGKPGRLVTAAKLFCIVFAMLLPSLLLIKVVL